MIQQLVKEQNSIPVIGGFVALYTNSIFAHVNPSRLQEQDLFILMQENKQF